VGGRKEMREMDRVRGRHRKGHGRLRVLGRAAVPGVTVGIHYLTVYCHFCGLRFRLGQEYRSITTCYVYVHTRTRARICMAKRDIPFSKTHLSKSRGFQLRFLLRVDDNTMIRGCASRL